MFCRTSFNLALSDAFLMARLGLRDLTGRPQRRNVILITSYQKHMLLTGPSLLMVT